jgi:6-phosphogluconate dehydrogenase
MNTEEKYEFGLIGLGVMGRNFILNVAENGFSALGYDLMPEKAEALRAEGADTGRVGATCDLKEFTGALSAPRRIMLLVPAGKVVDQVIEDLLPLLHAGDLLIDGGNSHFTDTDRRESYLKSKGIYFIGAGVSGGAEGARKGPSIMPGGAPEVYPRIQPVFEAVAARYKNVPCVAYLGPGSAGNYVKMVHNGIEYGLMQLTGECYQLLSALGGLTNSEISAVFGRWNQGRLQSFLIEITSEIFRKKDPLGPGDLIDAILDKAKQKGTGKWTSQNGMDLGIPVPTIDIAVSMRAISALKQAREAAGQRYVKPGHARQEKAFLESLCEPAMYFAFLMTYAQGLHQLAQASDDYGYKLDLATISEIWRAGCIIRASVLDDIASAFREEPQPAHLLLSGLFIQRITECVPSVRALLTLAIGSGIPMPALSASLSYFDAFTTARLPMNLIQAQRDYFGSHTYERTDREGPFHTEWQEPDTKP